MNIPTKRGFRKEDSKLTIPFLHLWSSCFFRVININFLMDHPMNIPTRFWCKFAQWFQRRRLKCKFTGDDWSQMMDGINSHDPLGQEC
jgi:hypothetical protein